MESCATARGQGLFGYLQNVSFLSIWLNSNKGHNPMRVLVPLLEFSRYQFRALVCLRSIPTLDVTVIPIWDPVSRPAVRTQSHSRADHGWVQGSLRSWAQRRPIQKTPWQRSQDNPGATIKLIEALSITHGS
jgi:hypothetical protein